MNSTIRIPIGLLIAGLSAVPAAGQERSPAIGAEIQAYPAGIITTVQLHVPTSGQDVIVAHAGLNTTDRRDFGEHDDERGDGPGVGIGYRRFLRPGFDAWWIGFRAEAWRLEIDWRDDTAPPRTGVTEVTVLQPTLRGGRTWHPAGPRFAVHAMAAFGLEINVATDGEPVGDGPILLGGVGMSLRF